MLSEALNQILSLAEQSPIPTQRAAAPAFRESVVKEGEDHHCFSCTKAVWVAAWASEGMWGLRLGACAAWVPLTMDNQMPGPFFCTAHSPEERANAYGSTGVVEAHFAGLTSSNHQAERQEAPRGQRRG